MADRPEDRAKRVEDKLESGDMSGAMAALQREMDGRTPEERGAILASLKEQNTKANEKDWTLPNVEITQNTEWLGFVKKEGEFTVTMSQNVIEQAGQAVNSVNPFNIAAKTLDKVNAEASEK
jgi:hypothetical protein